jgi:hypothetical protein
MYVGLLPQQGTAQDELQIDMEKITPQAFEKVIDLVRQARK